MAQIFSDPLPDIRWWMRHQTALAALHSGRVFFRIPDNQTLWPVIRIYQLGGQPVNQGGDIPLERLAVSCELWYGGSTVTVAYGGYPTLRSMTNILKSALQQLPSGTLLNPNGNTVATDAAVTGVIDRPDPDTGWPRIIVDTTWAVHAAAFT